MNLLSCSYKIKNSCKKTIETDNSVRYIAIANNVEEEPLQGNYTNTNNRKYAQKKTSKDNNTLKRKNLNVSKALSEHK